MSFSKNKHLTLCNPMDCSLPSFCVYRTSQTRILEWAAIPFSRIFLTQGLNTGLLHCTQILYLARLGGSDREGWGLATSPLCVSESER